MLYPQTITAMKKRYANGEDISDIAKRYFVSYQQVVSIFRRAGLWNLRILIDLVSDINKRRLLLVSKFIKAKIYNIDLDGYIRNDPVICDMYLKADKLAKKLLC